MAAILPYLVTEIPIDFGLDTIAGVGMEYQFTLTFDEPTNPAGGGKATILLNETNTGIITQVGAGQATGIDPTFCLTFNNKVYVLSGATVYFSALNAPSVWNDPNGLFNGFVTMSNYYATQDQLYAIAPYQGRLAFFSGYYIQFWIIDPNPDNWQLAQTLTNIGTFASNSVASLGDYDVLFLSYTGIRSLRTRDTTLNAYVTDLGSPIDSLVQAAIIASGLPIAATSCSVVDPSTGRYWLFIPNASDPNGVGKIYVLSYYPSNKIMAWSTYDPSYINEAGAVAYYVPQKFVFYKGQVYAKATDGNAYTFGGSNNNTYDVTVATVQVPFFDMQHPAHIKHSQAVDVDVASGEWDIYATADWINGTLSKTNNAAKATYDQGFIPFSSQGTHFSMEAICASASPAALSTLILHYKLANSPT